MKGESRENDGLGPSDCYYTPRQQSPFGPFCDTCWSEAVTTVNGVSLCRTHRKAYFGVSS